MRKNLKRLFTSLMMILILASSYGVHSLEKSQKNYVSKNVLVNILEYAARDTHPSTLRLVCKNWQETIDGKQIEITKEGTKYADIGRVWKQYVHAWYGATGHEEALKLFLNGKLIYRPTKGSDVGMIELKISDLPNPFESPFDLTKCGKTYEDLAIYPGFRKGKIEANKWKIEIWFAPRFMIEKFIKNDTKHFSSIMAKWDEKTAPIGIFYTGGWEELAWYDYLIAHDHSSLSSKNLYENHMRSGCSIKSSSFYHARLPSRHFFYVHFVN